MWLPEASFGNSEWGELAAKLNLSLSEGKHMVTSAHTSAHVRHETVTKVCEGSDRLLPLRSAPKTSVIIKIFPRVPASRKDL